MIAYEINICSSDVHKFFRMLQEVTDHNELGQKHDKMSRGDMPWHTRRSDFAAAHRLFAPESRGHSASEPLDIEPAIQRTTGAPEKNLSVFVMTLTGCFTLNERVPAMMPHGLGGSGHCRPSSSSHPRSMPAMSTDNVSWTSSKHHRVLPATQSVFAATMECHTGGETAARAATAAALHFRSGRHDLSKVS